MDIEGAIAEFKTHLKRPMTEQDWWELFVGSISIRKFFKGNLCSLGGGESGQDVYDRKLLECFGLEFHYHEPEKKATKRKPRQSKYGFGE